MLTVHVLRDVLSPAIGREDLTVTYCGQTPRTIRNLCKMPNMADDEVQVAVLGRVLGDEDLDRPLEDGDDLILAPRVAGAEFFAAAALFTLKVAASAALAVGINYAIAAIQGRPKPPQVRGDVQSPVYGWEGMATSFGVGTSKGWLYGRMRVPGQAISSSQFEVGNDDVAAFTLALCRGRVARIAGIDLRTQTDRNNLGGLYPGSASPVNPVGIKINGTLAEPRDIGCHLRAGVPWQTPVPGAARQFSTFSVQKVLPNGSGFGAPGRVPGPRYSATAAAKSVRARVHFDYLYDNTPTGPGPARASLSARVYDPATGAPVGAVQFLGDTGLRASTVGFNVTRTVTVPTDKPYDVELGMSSTAGNVSASWAVAIEELAGDADELAFPGLALAHLEIRGNEKLVGSEPTFTVPVDGRLVAWRLGGVWQDPEFDHAGTGKVPGRNPAWILWDWLTAADTLGRFVDASKLPADEFEDWAEFNDEAVDDGEGGTHPRNQCDLMIDRGESAWEVCQRIARTGGAVLIPNGDSFRIVYEHPDSVSHPRPLRGVFSEASVADFEIGYRGTLDLENILDAQILDEALDYEQNLVTETDPDAGLNDPFAYRAEPLRRGKRDLFGVCRAQQARRMLAFQLAWNRKSFCEVRFTTAVNAFGVEIGDWIGVQHEVPRWWDTDSAGFRTTRATTAATSVYLDHAVTLAPAVSYQLSGRDTAGNVVEVAITSPAGSYPADTALTVATAVTLRKGCELAFGVVDKVRELFQVTNLELTEGWLFRVTASLVDPAAYAVAPEGAQGPSVPAALESATSGGSAFGFTLERDQSGAAVLGWSPPFGARSSVRVYLREHWTTAQELEAVAAGDDARSRWRLIYEGFGDRLTLEELADGVVDVCGVTRTLDGVWLSPETATVSTLTLEEFPRWPPAAPQRLTLTACGDGILAEWPPLGEDVDFYELRRVGPDGTWLEAPVVARTQRCAFLLTTAPTGEQTYQLAARNRAGLYSRFRPSATITRDLPAGWPVSLDSWTDCNPTLAGTAVGCGVGADGSLELLPGFVFATYDTAELDAGSAAARWWSFNWSAWATWSGELPEDLELRSGEAAWWETDGRPASPRAPGVDFDLDTDDPALRIDDNATTFAGPAGAPGMHTRVRVLAAWDTGGGTFGAWVPFEAGPQVAARVKFRLVLERESELWQAHVAPGFAGEVSGLAAVVVPAHATTHKHGGGDEVATATPAANAIPKADAGGHLVAGWGGAASTLATLNASSKVVENPASATATATANAIPIATAAGKLDAGWGGAASTLATLDASGRLAQAAQTVWDGVSTVLTVAGIADGGVVVRIGTTLVTVPSTTWVVDTSSVITSAHLSADAVLAMRCYSTS